MCPVALWSTVGLGDSDQTELRAWGVRFAQQSLQARREPRPVVLGGGLRGQRDRAAGGMAGLDLRPSLR